MLDCVSCANGLGWRVGVVLDNRQPVWAGESVLYSITDNSVLYPATNRPVKVSIPESRTDIFTIDTETGKKRLLFSDASAKFFLVPAARGGIAAGGGRIFAVAVDRQDAANDPRSAGAVYELSIGFASRMALKITPDVSPRNGSIPVHISYSSAPKENRSVRGSSSFPRTCSGDI